MNVYLMFSVLLDLLRYEKITARQLAHKLGLSTRTIYRYVDSLSANGIPVTATTGRKGGIFLSQKYNLNSIYFTEQDLNLLMDLLCRSTDKNAVFVMQKLYLISNNKCKQQITQQS